MADKAPEATPPPVTEQTPPTPPPDTTQAPAIPTPERKVVTVDPRAALGLTSNPKDDLKTITDSMQEKANKNVTVSIENTPKPQPKEEPKVEPKEVPEVKPEAKVETPKPEVKKPEETPKPEAKKIKVGDTEYTQEELAELVKKSKEPAPTPKAEPVKEEPKSTTPPTPSEEDIKRDREWIDTVIADAATRNAPWLVSRDDLDKILDGDEDGVRLFNQKLAQARAEAELDARKWAAQAIEDQLKNIRTVTEPIVQNYEQVRAYQTEQAFFSRHKDLAVEGEGSQQRVNLVRKVSTALRNHTNPQIRQAVDQMTEEQFLDEVAKQTKDFMREMGIPLTPPKAQETVVETPPAPRVTSGPPPPVATPPGASAPSGKPIDWQSQTAISLRNG